LGTRSIFVVSGKASYNSPKEKRGSVRLYKHWDGYPTENLKVLVRATEIAKGLVDEHNARFSGESLSMESLAAQTFADCVVAATLGYYYGFGAHVDTWGDKDEKEAIFDGPLALDHFGEQGDLEWVYVVDVPDQVIRVYGNAYGPPSKHLKKGQVDPRCYAGHLASEAQSNERAAISAHMDRLAEMGWTLNPPGRLKLDKKKSAV
jgi:hypothetical protein